MVNRPLRRAGRGMPALVWEWDGSADRRVIEEAVGLGASWFYFAEAPSGSVDVPGIDVVLGVAADALQARRGAIVGERLREMGRSRCAAVMLRDVSAGAIKAGGPFHRLLQLRDQGMTDLFFAEGEDHETAEWLLHHTPAHAVALPLSLHDMTAKYRLLDDAAGFGTGIIARVGRSVWEAPRPVDVATHVSFIAGEEGVTAMILPLPREVSELRGTIAAYGAPMAAAERQQWWQWFQRQVPEPPPPVRGVAPDSA